MTDVLHITPSREAFLQHAQEGNDSGLPRDSVTSRRRFRPIAKFGRAGEAFLCESVEGGEHLSRYSFVGCNPRGTRQDGDQVQVVEGGGRRPPTR